MLKLISGAYNEWPQLLKGSFKYLAAENWKFLNGSYEGLTCRSLEIGEYL